MKRKLHVKRQPIPSVKLYREDLDTILSMFQANCESVTISDTHFVYESLDDLKNNVGAKVRDIEIVGRKPNISLTLMTGKVSSLSSISEGGELTQVEIDKIEVLFGRAKDFLMDRRRLMLRNLMIPIALAGVACIVAGAYILSKYYPQPKGDDRFTIMAMFSCFAVFGIAGAVRNGSLRRISLESRSAQSSFWKRNRDHILLALICGIIGSLITLGFEWLKHILSK